MRLLIIISCLFSLSIAQEKNIGKLLVKKYNCLSCHDFSQKRTGPSFAEIAKKYGTSEKSAEEVAKIIINPPSFMPPFKIPFSQAKAIAEYVLKEGAKAAKEKKKKEYDDSYLDLDSQFH